MYVDFNVNLLSRETHGLKDFKYQQLEGDLNHSLPKIKFSIDTAEQKNKKINREDGSLQPIGKLGGAARPKSPGAFRNTASACFTCEPSIPTKIDSGFVCEVCIQTIEKAKQQNREIQTRNIRKTHTEE